MGHLTVVVGGQYGSEGKGAVVGFLAHQAYGRKAAVAVVRVAGPNAGHTVIGTGPAGERGYAWRLRAVPVAAVTHPYASLWLAAGSEVEREVLETELAMLDAAGYDATSRMRVDAQATVLTEEHKQAESAAGLVGKIGSTGKGIGAARADRIMRSAGLYGGKVDVATELVMHLAGGGDVIVEGTQGYGLGLHAGYYPKCTSSDCRAIDFLAMAGISPWSAEIDSLRVIVTARTHPIRVAGDSGPMEGETTWDELGLEPELTTVTRKVRRVGAWDGDLVMRAVEANGGYPQATVALTMLDHVFPIMAGTTGTVSRKPNDSPGLPVEVLEYIERVEWQVATHVTLIGTGPATMLEITP